MENRLYPKFILTWSFPEDFLKGQQACVVLSVLYGKKNQVGERLYDKNMGNASFNRILSFLKANFSESLTC